MQIEMKANDFNCALKKIGGMEAVLELRKSWSWMDTRFGGLEWEQSAKG